jgi:hypothetical protein
MSGVALFFAPQWFSDSTYPPFNRHDAGDLDALLMPMGIAILIAARKLAQHCLLFGSLLRAAFSMRSITCWMNWCYRHW